jgi:hypothetical protein
MSKASINYPALRGRPGSGGCRIEIVGDHGLHRAARKRHFVGAAQQAVVAVGDEQNFAASLNNSGSRERDPPNWSPFPRPGSTQKRTMLWFDPFTSRKDPKHSELIELFLPRGGLLRFSPSLVKTNNMADSDAPFIG